MSDADWSRVTADLDSAVSEVLASIRAQNPRLIASSGSSANDSFVYRYYASFSRNGDRKEEDAVFSVDVKVADAGLRCESDIATGEGFVLAAVQPRILSTESENSALEKWLVTVREFLLRNAATLQGILGIVEEPKHE